MSSRKRRKTRRRPACIVDLANDFSPFDAKLGYEENVIPLRTQASADGNTGEVKSLAIAEHSIDEGEDELDAVAEEHCEKQPHPFQKMESTISMTKEEMDEMLKKTFFSSLRWRLDLQSRMPIDANHFFADYILKVWPEGNQLKIKKTSFKNFNAFLGEMNKSDQGWVVKLKTMKGIDSIEEVNFDHPEVLNALKPQEPAEESFGHGSKTATKAGTTAGVGGTASVSINDKMFSLTEQVMPLFRPAGFRKGDLVDFGKIRAVLLDYVREKNIAKGEQILLDDTLQMVIQHFLEEQFPLNKVVQRISAAMTIAVVERATDGVGGGRQVHRMEVPGVELKEF